MDGGRSVTDDTDLESISSSVSRRRPKHNAGVNQTLQHIVGVLKQIAEEEGRDRRVRMLAHLFVAL